MGVQIEIYRELAVSVRLAGAAGEPAAGSPSGRQPYPPTPAAADQLSFGQPPVARGRLFPAPIPAADCRNLSGYGSAGLVDRQLLGALVARR
jgi:hypothetical protein